MRDKERGEDEALAQEHEEWEAEMQHAPPAPADELTEVQIERTLRGLTTNVIRVIVR